MAGAASTGPSTFGASTYATKPMAGAYPYATGPMAGASPYMPGPMAGMPSPSLLNNIMQDYDWLKQEIAMLKTSIDPQLTRYVKIQAKKEHFAVSHVDVFAWTGGKDFTDVAQGKKAYSNCGSCFGPKQPGVITQGEARPKNHPEEEVWHAGGSGGLSDDWVEIDLAGYYRVQKVVFYNRNSKEYNRRAEGARVILLNANKQEIRSATLNEQLVQTLFDEK